MIQALLFDMDGTLIENSMDTFLPPYFSSLSKKMAHLVPPQKFITQLRASTDAMMNNTDLTRTLADVFASDFFSKVGAPREQMEPLFDEFYAREYRDLRAFIKPLDTAHTVMQRAFDSRRKVAIATGPFFPLDAIQQRLEWGDVGKFPYALITK
jgi:phosphoglycolate phosphatase-like HAD superfamily hydrolase